MSPKRALAILIVVSGLLRLVAAGALGLATMRRPTSFMRFIPT